MNSNPVFCDSQQFTVHEMSLFDVRSWLNEFTAEGLGGPVDIVGELAIEGINLKTLATICHCEVADFDQLTARELQLVADVARETNPHFFRLLKTIKQTAEVMVVEDRAGRFKFSAPEA